MKILLTRHGLSEDNIRSVVQGREGKLSSIGIEETRKLVNVLKNYNIDIIYTSDLNRCIETAEIVKESHPNAELIKTNLIAERDHGKLTGLTVDEYHKMKGLGHEDAETHKQWSERVKEFYKILMEIPDEKTALVISHGGTLKRIQELIFQKNKKKVIEFGEKTDGAIFKPTKTGKYELHPQLNSALSEIVIDKNGNFEIILYNSKNHLIDDKTFVFGFELD